MENTKSTYQLFIDMKNEIEKHKWIESEKSNKDIGFENALVDWMENYRSQWIHGNITNRN